MLCKQERPPGLKLIEALLFLATPQSYTAYVEALQTAEDELPELRVMLEEGFIQPGALTQAEMERRRQERLLRQFEEYLVTARGGRPLKEVRKEALVAGFTEAYRAGRRADLRLVRRGLWRRYAVGRHHRPGRALGHLAVVDPTTAARLCWTTSPPWPGAGTAMRVTFYHEGRSSIRVN